MKERSHHTGVVFEEQLRRKNQQIVPWHNSPLVNNIDLASGTDLIEVCRRYMRTHNTDLPPVVLTVEDEPLVWMLAADVFYEKGLDVLEAPDADGALTLLKDHTDIDVLFTHINMPEALNGVDLAWEVHRRWPRVALMITSARQGTAIDDMPSTAMFVPKPYDLEKIAGRIVDLRSHR